MSDEQRTPKRIQRRRVKGWRLPAGAVCVNRPSRWGNPFDWREGVEVGGIAWAKGIAVELFREWLHHPSRFPDKPVPPTRIEIKALLSGRDLACFCGPNTPCHADVLLEIANAA